MIEADPYTFEIIGRAIVAWSDFDRLIISHTWASRDPSGGSPFPVGAIQRQFKARWSEWLRIHRPYATDAAAFERLANEVRALHDIRDDIAHNVVEVSLTSRGKEFGLHIWRQLHVEWRTAFERWAERYAHIHFRSRPEAPGDRQFWYTERDVLQFIERTRAAYALAKEYSAALVGSKSGHPST